MSLKRECQGSDDRAHASTQDVVPENGVGLAQVRGFQEGDRVITQPSFLEEDEKRVFSWTVNWNRPRAAVWRPLHNAAEHAGIALVVGRRSTNSVTEFFVVYEDCAFLCFNHF